MPSPFPGMDPYLEAHWRDIHAGLVVYACDSLQPLLPRALRARIAEYELIESSYGIGNHPLLPDVRVITFGSEMPRVLNTKYDLSARLSDPIIIDVNADPELETFIEIVERTNDNHVVTVIEFLSPSNKSPGKNRAKYLEKQRKLIDSGANLVEIDLNRFGTHILAFPLHHLREHCHTG